MKNIRFTNIIVGRQIANDLHEELHRMYIQLDNKDFANIVRHSTATDVSNIRTRIKTCEWCK